VNPELTKYLRNVAYAMSASQGGCVTVVVIFAALFVGLWLDAELHTKPLFTLLFIFTSIPVSLYLMLRVALGAARRLTPPKPRPPKQEE